MDFSSSILLLIDGGKVLLRRRVRFGKTLVRFVEKKMSLMIDFDPKDYAVQKLLLYYDTPNQWPLAYDQKRVRY